MENLRINKNKIETINQKIDKTSFTLVKIGIVSFSLNLIASLAFLNENAIKIPYTDIDKEYKKIYEQEYQQIEKEKLDFQNEELLKIIKNQCVKEEITKKDLYDIKELKITSLINQDLSDLKYCKNLEILYLEDMNIDLEDLKYNKYLHRLTLKECDLHNTFYLPNAIKIFIAESCTIKDDEFIVPYQTEFIKIMNTNFNNLHFKNPEKIKHFWCQTNSLLDLEWLKECRNLEKIMLYCCANVKNPNILNLLDKITEIHLNDYCIIWMPTSLLETLKGKIKMNLYTDQEYRFNYDIEDYIELSKKIDKIASTLNEEGMTDEEKVCQIILYLMRKYQYNYDLTMKEITCYNYAPIYFSFESDEIICINYATLFTTLANRMGLINYQGYTSEHTWNQVLLDGEIGNYDVTSLDTEKQKVIVFKQTSEEGNFEQEEESIEYFLENGDGDLLAFYNFSEEERLKYGVELTNPICYDYEKNENIGYIEEQKTIGIYIRTIGFIPSVFFLLLAGACQMTKKGINNSISYIKRKNILKKIRKESE